MTLMTKEMDDRTLARVAKLLNLGRDARTNENEAAAAVALAQRIVAEYGLELHEIEAAKDKGSVQGGEREKRAVQKSAMYRYQQRLMETLAKMNFCRYFLNEEHAQSFGKMRRVKRHVLLGRRVYVTTAEIMYDYLVETMDRLLPYQGMEKRGKEALLWLDGCSARLIERLEQKRKEDEEERARKAREDEVRSRHPGAAPASRNALVLADVYSTEEDFNTDFQYGLEPGTTTAKRREAEARAAAHQAEIEKKTRILVSNGMDEEKAYYIARGYSMEDAVRYTTWNPGPSKTETEAQRRKRERSERAWENRYYRRQAREAERTSHPAYRQGRDAGGTIGLDAQVKSDDRKRIR